MLKVACFLALLLPSAVLAVDYTWPTYYEWPAVQSEPLKWIGYFGQKSCGPCVQFLDQEVPKLKKAGWLVEKWGVTGNVQLVDINEFPDLADKFNVEATPTYILFKGDKVLGTRVGFQTAEQIKDWLTKGPATGSPVLRSYPRRRVNWTGPDGRHQLGSKVEAVQHLLFDGNHVGKFNRQELESLTLDELRALHSDDHENRIKWKYLRN